MKILYVLDFEPFIEDKDGLTKIYYNLIKHLSKVSYIDLLIITEKNFELTKEFYSVKNIYYEQIKLSKFDKNVNRLMFNFYTTLSKKRVKYLYYKYNMIKYDIIHTAHLFFANISYFHDKVILGATDASSLAMNTRTIRERLRKFYFRKIEQKLSKMNLFIHTVTKKDYDGFDTTRKFIITNGVDTNKYKKFYSDKKMKNSFAFHGNLDYQPNIDAIFYMSKVIKDIQLNYKLYIIGRGNTSIYTQLDNVIVIGEVDNIAYELSKYEYYLILMKSGTGVKNKLLEAMSCGCTVIANSLAVNGLNNKSLLMNSIYIIDDKTEIVHILKSRKMKDAREYILKNFSWNNFSIEFMKQYKRIMNFRKKN